MNPTTVRDLCAAFHWSNGWRFFVTGIAAGALGCIGGGSLGAQEAEVDLRIRNAIELEYQSTPGRVYDVQSSSDNQSWRSVGESYFGDGAKVVDLISYRQTGDKSKFFRVRVRDAREVGIGPVSLAGTTYLLNDGGLLRTIRFENAATGSVALDDEASKSFRYGFLKTGASNGRLQMLFGDDTSETVSMTFATDSAGTFQCDRFESGDLFDTDAGTFSRIYLNGDTSLSYESDMDAPESPIGYSLVLFAGDQGNVIRILNDVTVKESMLNSSTSYQYDYAVSDGVGQLTVWKARDRHDFYEFNFTSVGSGEFKRSQYSDGALVDADAGVFSVFGAPSNVDGDVAVPLDADGGLVHFPESPESPEGGDRPREEIQCDMPGEMEGICVEVTANGKSEKLCFYTEGAGSQVRDLEGTTAFVPFDYTYEPQDGKSGRIVIEFATSEGDEKIVYELRLDDGCNGSYTRTTYLGDRITGQENGRFSMSAEIVVPDNALAGGAAIIANPNRIGVAAEVIRTTILKD